MKVGKWKLLLPLALLVAVRPRSRPRVRSPRRRRAATVKVAIMTDCKGAFAFGYELDIGGAHRRVLPVRGREAEEQARSRRPA